MKDEKSHILTANDICIIEAISEELSKKDEYISKYKEALEKAFDEAIVKKELKPHLWSQPVLCEVVDFSEDIYKLINQEVFPLDGIRKLNEYCKKSSIVEKLGEIEKACGDLAEREDFVTDTHIKAEHMDIMYFAIDEYNNAIKEFKDEFLSFIPDTERCAISTSIEKRVAADVSSINEYLRKMMITDVESEMVEYLDKLKKRVPLLKAGVETIIKYLYQNTREIIEDVDCNRGNYLSKIARKKGYSIKPGNVVRFFAGSDYNPRYAFK